MAIRVPDHSRRRLAGNAQSTPNPRGAFGNLVESPAGAPSVPGGIYGDARGDMALATSLEQGLGRIGETITNVAIRQERMREAEEESLLKDMTARYDVAESEVRLRIEKERQGKVMTADEISRRYEEEMRTQRSKILGGVEFKTDVGRNANRMFDLRQRQYSARYNAGTVEQIRMDNIRASMVSESAAHMRMASTGNPLDWETAKKNIADLASSPQYVAAFGADKAIDNMNEMLNQASTNYYRQRIDENPALSLEELEGGPIDGLHERTRASLIKTAEGELRKKEAEAREAQGKVFKENDGELFDLMRAGRLTPDEVQRRADAGLINEAQRQKWIGRYDMGVRARQTQVNHFADVSSLAAEGIKSADAKQVNAWWKTMSETEGMVNAEGRLTLAGFDQIVNSVSVLPVQVRRQIQRDLVSRNPLQMASASQTIVKLTDENPSLTKSFKQHDMQVAELIVAGADPLEAAEQVAANQAMTKQQRTDISAAFSSIAQTEKLTDSQTVAGILEDEFDLDLDAVSLVQQAPGIVTNYSTLLEGHFVATRDIEVAKKLALKDLKQKWAVTGVGGERRLMPWAPEAAEGSPGGNTTDWMQFQFERDMKALGRDPEKMSIVSDRVTYSSVEPSVGRRTWQVVTEDDFGRLMNVVDENGMPVRWHPDASLIDQQLEEARVEEVAAARQALVDKLERAERMPARNKVMRDARIARIEREIQEFDEEQAGLTPEGIRARNAEARRELLKKKEREADLFNDMMLAP